MTLRLSIRVAAGNFRKVLQPHPAVSRGLMPDKECTYHKNCSLFSRSSSIRANGRYRSNSLIRSCTDSPRCFSSRNARTCSAFSAACFVCEHTKPSSRQPRQYMGLHSRHTASIRLGEPNLVWMSCKQWPNVCLYSTGSKRKKRSAGEPLSNAINNISRRRASSCSGMLVARRYAKNL